LFFPQGETLSLTTIQNKRLYAITNTFIYIITHDAIARTCHAKKRPVYASFDKNKTMKISAFL
jgi:hypothetical protein